MTKLRDGRASVAELANRTLLVREIGSSTRAAAERALARVGYQPAKRWELDSNEAIKRSVAAGLGVGFVSRLVVEEELQRGVPPTWRDARSSRLHGDQNAAERKPDTGT